MCVARFSLRRTEIYKITGKATRQAAESQRKNRELNLTSQQLQRGKEDHRTLDQRRLDARRWLFIKKKRSSYNHEKGCNTDSGVSKEKK